MAALGAVTEALPAARGSVLGSVLLAPAGENNELPRCSPLTVSFSSKLFPLLNVGVGRLGFFKKGTALLFYFH